MNSNLFFMVVNLALSLSLGVYFHNGWSAVPNACAAVLFAFLYYKEPQQ